MFFSNKKTRDYYIIELVGPAGAGKTTILNALLNTDKTISTANPPSLSRTLSINSFFNSLFFFKFFINSLPSLFHFYKYKNIDINLIIQEISFIAILNGWHNYIQKRIKKNSRFLVLDQGPVYMLAKLHILSSDYLSEICSQKWWKKLSRKWLNVIDMIVYLDTSNNHLIDRICQRRKWHPVKYKNIPEAYKFLCLNRTSYKYVISTFTDNRSDFKILSFDTRICSLEQILNQLMLEFNTMDISCKSQQNLFKSFSL